MTESDHASPSLFWRRVRITVLSVVMLFLGATAIILTAAKLQYGRGFTTTNLIEIGALAAVLLGCGLLLVRQLRVPTGEAPLTRQERLNRNLLIVSGLLGGVTSLAMALAVDGGPEGGGALSNEPLPPVVAVLLILVLGVLVPAISLYWQRIIDEQEADAYKTGAVAALYVFLIGGPIWWLAWRGGFVRPPDGFVVYFATAATLGAVWLWKKYR